MVSIVTEPNLIDLAVQLFRLSDAEAEEFVLEARARVATTMWATGEYFTLAPLDSELALGAPRGRLCGPDQPHAFSFEFDAQNRLRVAMNGTSFFRYSGDFVEQLRFDDARATRVAVARVYRRDAAGRIVQFAGTNRSHTNFEATYAYNSVGLIDSVICSASGWPSPQTYTVHHVGDVLDWIRLENTGELIYRRKTRSVPSLIASLRALLLRDITGWDSGAEPTLAIALAYNGDSPQELVPPWVLACPSELAVSRTGEELFDPLLFTDSLDIVRELMFRPDTLAVASELRLALRSGADIGRLVSMYRSLARSLSKETADGDLFFYVAEYESGSTLESLKKSVNPQTLSRLKKLGLLPLKA
jgi:hypothetical protein